MKKLLLVALLMLALVITAVACNNEPADTTGETTATQTPATAEPDDSTAAPETPTEAPEVPTEAPEVPTEAPVTQAPEVPTDAPVTQAPVVTTEPETEAPVDPMAPVNVFEAADISTLTGVNGVASADLVDNYLHVVPSTADPYWYPFANVEGARYVVVRYRTDATGADIQFYIGSTGTGPADDSTMLRQPAVADGEWHLAIIDTQSLIDAGKYDGSTVAYFRFDPLEAGYILDENGQPQKPDGQNYLRYELPANCYIDVEYVAFFNSAEAAEKYDADTHFVVPPHDDLTLVLGVRDGGTPFSGAPAKKFGQRGQIGENFLKNVTIVDLATYADNNTNTWSFKVWQWDTDYATTVAGEPLFVKEGENAPDNTTFSMDIPAELGIRGDIYYEIEYLSGTGTFTGWTAKDVVPGLETYVAGELKAGGYAASITVGVAKPASYDNLTIDILSTDNKGSGANVVPSWPEAGWSDTPVIQMMNWGSYVSLGEIDLSKYSAVVITYGSDASAVQGDVGTFLALTKNGAAENADSSDKADAEIIAQGTLANAGGGWTTTREVTIAIDSDYVGEVFLAQDMKDNNGIAITSIVFIGAEIPAEPETPVVELTPFEGNFHANVDFINGGSKDGAGVPYQGLGSSMINGTNGVLVVRNAAEDNIVVNADNTINIQGWMAVQGGINHYAYSVNGGELITAVGGADGEPLADYYAGLGMADSTKMGLFNGGNMLVADLSAYAGQTVTVTFYAVPEAAQDTVAPIVSVEGLVVPEAAEEPEAPVVESVVIDPRELPEGSITGHMTHIVTEADTNHFPMINAAGLTSGAMIHQGSIYLGEFDLTKYEKVIIYYATDWGQGTQDALAAAKEQGFGYLGLSAIDCNNVVNPNREAFIGELYTPDGMWQITAHELPNVAASGYSGPVYVSADFLASQFIIIDRIEFIAK